MTTPTKDGMVGGNTNQVMTILLSRVDSIASDCKAMAGTLGVAIADIRQQLGKVENKLDNVIKDIEGGANEKPLPTRVERIETQIETIQGQLIRIESSAADAGQKQWKLWLAIINSFLFPILVMAVGWLIFREANLGK